MSNPDPTDPRQEDPYEVNTVDLPGEEDTPGQPPIDPEPQEPKGLPGLESEQE